MKERLPIEIENRDLPVDKYKKIDDFENTSLGYVNIVTLLSLITMIIILGTVLIIMLRGSAI